MKRFLGLLGLLALAGCMVPHQVKAQFIGYTMPQTVSQTLATAVACTGSLQTFSINNLGQSSHLLIWTSSGTVGLSVSLAGSPDGTTFSQFSDAAWQSSGSLQATGYYVSLQARVLCNSSAGTFTMFYAGTPSFALQPTGFIDRTIFAKVLGIGLPSNTTRTTTITVPYGNSGGILYFVGTLPAASTLTVTTADSSSSGTLTLINAAALTGSQQAFLVPAVATVQLAITFTSGGASAGTYNAEMEFFKPGQIPSSADPCRFSILVNCPTFPP